MPSTTPPLAWCPPPPPSTALHNTCTPSLSTPFRNRAKLRIRPRRRTRTRARARVTASLAPAPPEDPDAPPALQLGLLTDSVLEVKWKQEAEGGDREEDGEGDHSTPPCPAVMPDDLSASDPYKAFAQFTRIAAPTAALGRDGFASPLLRTVPHLLRSPDLQYSAASIAYRLMRYTYAKKNMADFLDLFEGDFDNYDQVVAERRESMLPRDGGGHEHIHCSIRRLSPDLVFARYYFNGDPSNVFRSRLYKLKISDDCERGIVEMRIFRFYEETEQKLKAQNYDVNAIEWDDGDVYDWLEGCEVYWERYEPQGDEADDASKRLGIDPGLRFVGYMEGGGCELHSRELGGRIRVMDDLLLTSEELWVADRGFDEQDRFVYGNQRGVPYKMKRVHSGSAAAWTLSETEVPPEGYIP